MKNFTEEEIIKEELRNLEKSKQYYNFKIKSRILCAIAPFIVMAGIGSYPETIKEYSKTSFYNKNKETTTFFSSDDDLDTYTISVYGKWEKAVDFNNTQYQNCYERKYMEVDINSLTSEEVDELISGNPLIIDLIIKSRKELVQIERATYVSEEELEVAGYAFINEYKETGNVEKKVNMEKLWTTSLLGAGFSLSMLFLTALSKETDCFMQKERFYQQLIERTRK